MTSVLIAASFLILLVTGIVLFASPPGRIANWTNWNILGLRKHDWTGLHIWFSALFLVVTIFHVIFNWRPMISYFKDRLSRRVGFRWEWVVALGIVGGVFAGTRLAIPPFSSLLAWNEDLKESWDSPAGRAPIPHAELLTLTELAEQGNVPVEAAVARLAARGVEGFSHDTVVQKIAEDAKLSARQVYDIILASAERSAGHGQGQGRGGQGGGGGGGGAGGGPVTLLAAAAPEVGKASLEERALARGRQAATRTFGLLSSNLQNAIKTTGITNALPYCSVLADPLTQQVARELNADVRRVTHRPRNLKGAASAEELELIKRYQAALARDTNAVAPTLVTSRTDRIVFYSPIVITNTLCLQCHGVAGTDVRPETLTAIKKLYPSDQATGFKLGDLRGLWRVEFTRASLEKER